MKTPLSLLVRLLPTAALLVTGAAAQTTIHVPGDTATIQSAITAAVDGDTILVDPGTYFEHGISLQGKAIRLASTGGSSVTTLDAQLADRAFFFRSGEDDRTIVEGFRIVQARLAGSTGGAIFIQDASPVLRDLRIESGVGAAGGGVYVLGGAPLLEDCAFLGCSASLQGGGAYLDATAAVFRRCTIQSSRSGNGGTGAAGYAGGGAYVLDSTAVFEGCRFLSNRSGNGGTGKTGSNGANGAVGTPPKNGGTGGTGGKGGPGAGAYVSGGSPLFVNCYFDGNRTGDGGRGGRGGNGGDGIAFQDGANGGRGGNGGQGGIGGAAYVQGGTPRLAHCTMVLNTVGSGGSGGSGGSPGSGGFGASNGSPGPSGSGGTVGFCGGLYDLGGAVMQNSISWFNASAQVAGAAVDYSNVQGGAGGTGNISQDPLLSGAELLAGSPCIDAGNDVWIPAGITTDIDGEPRAFEDPLEPNGPNGSTADMGCDEFVQPFLVPIGCAPATTLLSQGLPRPGKKLHFEVVDDAACVGRGALLRTALLVGTVNTGMPCGLPTAGGGLMLDLDQPLSILWGAGPSGTSFDLLLPADPGLVGHQFGVQGVSIAPRRIGDPSCPSSSWNLLGARHAVVGP